MQNKKKHRYIPSPGMNVDGPYKFRKLIAELFDCCLKRTIYKNKFEMTHVGLSQVCCYFINYIQIKITYPLFFDELTKHIGYPVELNQKMTIFEKIHMNY
jgi:hypothetical protein